MAAAIEGAMPSRQKKSPLPRLWLFTDERIADGALLAAVAALPKGSGVVFRHYERTTAGRQALFGKIRVLARRRRLTLLLGGDARHSAFRGADGTHSGGAARRATPMKAGLQSASAHSLAELRSAERRGADIIFLSPVFPTRSHPGARPLGALRFALLARHTRVPIVALGGMTKARFRRLRGMGAYGWAGIDALTRE